MEPVERSQELPVHELAVLHQCLATLALAPAVRHRLEQALSQSTEQLRQRLALMSQQAKRFALLSEIAAKMAHEIRNLQYAIVLHVDILEEEVQQPTADSQAQMVESTANIRTDVTRLYDMMQDYLTLVRLAGLQREPKELATLVKDTVHAVQEQAEMQGVTLCLEDLTHLGHVPLHHASLHRALSILIQRALYAMPHGGILTLRGHRTLSQVVLEVQDTGSSIPDAQLHLFFEPFHNTGATCTGLQFYMMREIITAHGGTVTVQSATGQGTTFTITLPLLATASPAALDSDTA